MSKKMLTLYVMILVISYSCSSSHLGKTAESLTKVDECATNTQIRVSSTRNRLETLFVAKEHYDVSTGLIKSSERTEFYNYSFRHSKKNYFRRSDGKVKALERIDFKDGSVDDTATYFSAHHCEVDNSDKLSPYQYGYKNSVTINDSLNAFIMCRKNKTDTVMFLRETPCKLVMGDVRITTERVKDTLFYFISEYGGQKRKHKCEVFFGDTLKKVYYFFRDENQRNYRLGKSFANAILLPEGFNTNETYTVYCDSMLYQYNDLAKPIKVTQFFDGSSIITNIFYNRNGDVKMITDEYRFLKSKGKKSKKVYLYHYDERDLLKNIAFKFHTGYKTIMSFEYGFPRKYQPNFERLFY